jgi:hypothetical protein
MALMGPGTNVRDEGPDLKAAFIRADFRGLKPTAPSGIISGGADCWEGLCIVEGAEASGP